MARMNPEPKMFQYESELIAFIEIIKNEKIKSYLEIGSRLGGSLWRIGKNLPKGSRIVAVDLDVKKTLASLQEAARALMDLGYDVHLIVGDSTDHSIVERVRALGPFDMCFIDGDHTEPFVIKDWLNYGPMCRIVAFHDINFWRGSDQPQFEIPIDVPKVWKRIKGAYRHAEIKHDKQDYGIGILWQ